MFVHWLTPQRREILRKGLHGFGYLLTIASIFFVARILFSMDLKQLPRQDPGNVIGKLVILSFLYCPVVAALCAGYTRILAFVSGRAVPFRSVFPIYAKSNAMKYLPGNVMEFVGRNLLGRSLGLSQKQLAFGSLLETVIILTAAFIIALSLPWTGIFPAGWLSAYWVSYRTTAFIILLALLVIFCVVVFILMRSRVDLTRYRKYHSVLFFRLGGFILLLHMAVLSGLGLLLGIIFKLFFPGQIGWFDLVRINAAFSLAWVIGFLTPGASGGLGVKEALLVITLSPVYGKEITVMAALLHRIVSVSGDFLTLLVGWVMRRRDPPALEARS